MKIPEGFRKEHGPLPGNSQSSGNKDIIKQCGVFISNFTIIGAQPWVLGQQEDSNQGGLSGCACYCLK